MTHPPSPGDYIREELRKRNWTQEDLAEVLGRSNSRVSQLLSGKQELSTEIALELETAFGTPATVWLQREAEHKLSRAAAPMESVRRKAQMFEFAPIREMEKRGWIRQTTTPDELESELKRFYAVDDLTTPPKFPVTTRRTTSEEVFEELSPLQRAWSFRARAMAAEQIIGQYDPNKFNDCLRELRKLAAFAPEIRKVPAVLNKYGIRFVIVEHLPSAKIDGAAFWVDGSPAIAMSLRFDRIDAFWFTLCHELAHIKNEDPISIDSSLVGEGAEPSAMKLEFEERADNEASTMLIPQDKIQSFIRRVAPLYSKERIIQFAHVVQIHPGLIVGQLQHRGEIGFHANRELLVKVREQAISGAIVDGWKHAST